jgi:hypothetical protein
VTGIATFVPQLVAQFSHGMSYHHQVFVKNLFDFIVSQSDRPAVCPEKIPEKIPRNFHTWAFHAITPHVMVDTRLVVHDLNIL